MDVLKSILDQILSKSRASVLRYSRDFDRLWEFTDDHEKVFIIWDRTPEGEFERIPTGNYLTPVDWAVCAAANARVSESDAQRVPSLKVAVLDLNPGAHSSTPLARDIYRLKPTAVPWLRLLQTADLLAFGQDSPTALEAILFPEFHGSVAFWNWTVEDLQQRIRTHLTGAGDEAKIDRHAITNIVGPYRLGALPGRVEADNIFYAPDSELTRPASAETPLEVAQSVVGLRVTESDTAASAPKANHRTALLRLFEHTKLLKTARNVLGSPGWAVRVSGDTPDPLSTVTTDQFRILLLDDQWDDGWLHWIHNAFDATAKLYVSRSAEGIVNTLAKRLNELKQASLNQEIRERDLRFKLTLWPEDVGKGIGSEILILDLRLFQGVHSDEISFFQRVIKLCRHFEAAGDHEFAWAGAFSAEELNRLDDWCDDKNRHHEASDHFAALTLLPRLLALLDMSYPVILFSSTGQADVKEHLKSFRNIITSFSKPRFFSGAEEGISRRTQESFVAAIHTARQITRIRQQCAHITQYRATGNVGVDRKEKCHAEIYIDETGSENDPTLTIAGAYALFASTSDPIKSADQFDDLLVAQGIRYFESSGTGTQPTPPRSKPKRDKVANTNDCHAELKEVLEKKYKPKQLGLATVTAQGPYPDDFSRITTYKAKLRDLIELLLFESIPALFGNDLPKSLTVSIYAATRLLSIPNEQDRVRLTQQYGLRESRYLPGKFYYIDRDDMYQLVRDIMETRGCKRNIERALAVQLVYGAELSERAREGFFRCRMCGRNASGAEAFVNGMFNERIFKAGPLDPALLLARFQRIDPLSRECVIFDYFTDCELRAPVRGSVRPQSGDIVVYTRQPRGVCIDRLATEDDQVKRLRSHLHTCNDNGDWQPDYRALQYVVDQLLVGGMGRFGYYRSLFEGAAGNFSDEADERFDGFLRVSREIEHGKLANALSLFPPLPCRNGRFFEPSVEALICTRMAVELPKLCGIDFFAAVDQARENGQ